ncbi:MAG: phosphodiesterase [Rhodospirillaceae bacterium]|nr:MAG: phosphodiesterase [Rhodospirillaceae bacterium]
MISDDELKSPFYIDHPKRGLWPSSFGLIALIWGLIAGLLITGFISILWHAIRETGAQDHPLFIPSIVMCSALVALITIAVPCTIRHRAEIAAIRFKLNAIQGATTGVLDGMVDGVLLADIRQAGMPLVFVNKGYEAITGCTASEAIGRKYPYLQSTDRFQSDLSDIRQAMLACREVAITMQSCRKDGTTFWNELRLRPIALSGKEPTHYIGFLRDVTEVVELKRVGHVDQITKAANRSYFFDQVAALTRIGDADLIMVVKIDIARFHEINDSYGHEVGDELLAQTAARLGKLRAACVARLAADEFGLAVRLEKPEDAKNVISTLRAVLCPKFVLAGTTVHVRFAIGYAVGARGEDAMTLMRHAGVALQESRRSRLREVRGFDSHTDRNVRNRIRLTHELSQAVADSDFELHYQPKVDIDSGAIIGVEGLVRWRHPLFGLQAPGRFISLAEETGIIVDIGSWVMREGMCFAARLNQGRAAPLTVSINVSQAQFTSCDMVAHLGELLRETGADPSWLMLELTETLFADGSLEMIGTFKRIRELGIGLSIDDFGTGYSSLRYLERFPISEVKLDKSFVEDMHQSRVKQTVVDAIITLGKALDIAVTAEGVESEAERALLQHAGCRYGQGYLFGRPLPEQDIIEVIRNEDAKAVSTQSSAATN